MSKVITSPLKEWQGTVTLAKPMTLPQAEAFEATLEVPKELPADGMVFNTVFDKQKLPALLACVEKWELTDFPELPTLDTFPFSPRSLSHQLIEWIHGEILKIYIGESEIPNES